MAKMTLPEAVTAFIHDRCAGLGHDSEKTAMEKQTGTYLGKSLKENQVPYNMQMDTDRLCLENAILQFLASGTAKDAFDVYFCYMEMFIGGYGKSRRIVELLSEFENNGSSLLMKHRDHYSHSVYVFALGLAIFETNPDFRKLYCKFYGFAADADTPNSAHHFLKYWGITALFHDIGYPLELPFEQAASYFEVNNENRSQRPYLAYHALDDYAGNIREALAENITKQLGETYKFTYAEILDVIIRKPQHPEQFNYFMDHAYFSAVILYHRVYDALGIKPNRADMDALSAIILHNSMYKFSIAHYKNDGNIPLKAELAPLAYMLMLCDELQCWDRTAYGRNSRTELQPMDCKFEFSSKAIEAFYVYDKAQQYKQTRLKKKSPGKEAFDADIASIVDTSLVGLRSAIVWEERNRSRKHTYLSDSNFMNLYNFAVALNGRWMLGKEWKQAKAEGKSAEFLTANREIFQSAFEKMSLEYKLSNINQAKNFDKYLNCIGAFYTDREVDFDELTAFSEEQCLVFGPLEHERWLKEHIDMGWKFGNAAGDERELKRIHKDMLDDSLLVSGDLTAEAASLHYKMLDMAERDKDIEPMNAMLELLKIYDGVRIYSLS